MSEIGLRNCLVCGSANLNAFRGPTKPWEARWCEDCGTMHVENYDGVTWNVWQPEKSMLHHQVLAFHHRFGQAIGEKPHVVDGKTTRFRLSLIMEEFFELLEAAGVWGDVPGAIDLVKAKLNEALEIPSSRGVDLPAFVDALADLMYVIEGAAITMGVNMTPILAEVQNANMAKLPSYVAAKDASHRGEVKRRLRTCVEVWPECASGEYNPSCCRFPKSCSCTVYSDDIADSALEPAAPIKRADGKIEKPEGWKPPDILGELCEQGYKP